MVQTRTICCTAPAKQSETRQATKDNKRAAIPFQRRGNDLKKAVVEKRKSPVPVKVTAKETQPEVQQPEVQQPPLTDDVGKQESEKERKITSVVEYLKAKRMEERLAKEKKAEEEKEQFMKEAAERKAAEREEVIKQARRMFLYRKPMCRLINRALLRSECMRELDAQIKFQETLRNADRDMELSYVKSMRADVEMYEAEMKKKTEQLMETRKNYAEDLKRQIEENRIAATTKEKEEFEADKLDQINMKKRLEDIKEYELQQLRDKKEKLRGFFKDAIEEKQQTDLKLKREEEFEDRVTDIYRNAKEKIQKMQKSMVKKEMEQKERKAQFMAENYRKFLKSTAELEQEIFEKAVAEQEEQYRERQKHKQDHDLQVRTEIHDTRAKLMAAKSERLREEEDLKIWETMQRFKKVEYDKEWEAEERKREWNEKMECAENLKKLMAEKKTREDMERQDMEDAAALAKKIMDKENQRVLDYGDEVLNESKGVRPLYPILKAVEECKKEIGLIVPKKIGETVDTESKRKRRIPVKRTRYAPDDKVLYL